MQVSLLRAKLHHARVTHADIHYVGSITIDQHLLDESGILPYEEVLVVDIENGSRLRTYAIPGEAHSGVIKMNGAAARLVGVGDRVIIMSFAYVDFPPPEDYEPTVLVLSPDNKIVMNPSAE